VICEEKRRRRRREKREDGKKILFICMGGFNFDGNGDFPIGFVKYVTRDWYIVLVTLRDLFDSPARFSVCLSPSSEVSLSCSVHRG